MPKHMITYDVMETARNTNEWLGATARALGSYPAFGLVTNPAFQIMAAWGEVTERSFSRMVAKPDWGIDTVPGEDGRDHVVSVRTVLERPFGDLVKFAVSGREPMARQVLLVAPMSGHYATLLRSTVRSLIPDCDVYVTDWHNARDIPVSVGKFDVEDYTVYLADFVRELGPDIHVVAVCQPVPLALAATAWLAEEAPDAQPASLTLIGGPVDPDANATDVTDFGRRVTMGQLERQIIQRVGFMHAGAGRLVYPGLLQLASFMSMNAERHSRAFSEQILRVAKGEASDHDKHNRFYDEYLAVMDMTAEFYLSTVERVFKGREIARNAFSVAGRPVDIGQITDVAVMVVEGEKDDISAPGQCLAALDLLTGLPASRKSSHLEPGAGHYGIFAGGSWRRNIRPLVLSFIDEHSRATRHAGTHPPERPAEPAPGTMAEVERIAEGAAPSGPARRQPRRAAAGPTRTRRRPVADVPAPKRAPRRPAAAKSMPASTTASDAQAAPGPKARTAPAEAPAAAEAKGPGAGPARKAAPGPNGAAPTTAGAAPVGEPVPAKGSPGAEGPNAVPPSDEAPAKAPAPRAKRAAPKTAAAPAKAASPKPGSTAGKAEPAAASREAAASNDDGAGKTGPKAEERSPSDKGGKNGPTPV